MNKPLLYMYNMNIFWNIKSRLFKIFNCFFSKNRSRRFNSLVIGQSQNYFVDNHSDCAHKYAEMNIKKDS